MFIPMSVFHIGIEADTPQSGGDSGLARPVCLSPSPSLSMWQPRLSTLQTLPPALALEHHVLRGNATVLLTLYFVPLWCS